MTVTALAGDDAVAAVKGERRLGRGLQLQGHRQARCDGAGLRRDTPRRNGCVIGIGHYTENFPLDACGFPADAKTVIGCMYGNANFRVDMPNLLELYLAPRLDLDAMVTRTYAIDDARRPSTICAPVSTPAE